MSLKHTLKESLTFSKKERIGIIFLVPVILIIAFLPFFQKQPGQAKRSSADSIWLATANNLLEKNTSEPSAGPDDLSAPVSSHFPVDKTAGSYNNPAKSVLFNFDPNTLDAGGFTKLGLRDKTIRTLINYRNKGGKFRKPDDLAKVYGLRQEEFQRLKPYITIANSTGRGDYYHPNNNYKNRDQEGYISSERKPRYTLKIIDINAADIAGFESLYGIGNKLASKIINFRDKLGGFYSVDQVGETYGIPDSTFQKIKTQLKVDGRSIKKININTASYAELNNHPYISAKLAFQILKERKEKGNFASIEAVKDLAMQPTDDYDKFSRYITVGN
ncbi:helix-hairpin-helix domain-containing protein [Niabella yanshanensis]|uniref:Helix-hairpin-helix domain-containing protein n=1 Tax=Niabella yanshanensis TaxID=577386 RepID=A0ABZ0WCV3_9BACT|nr:helix-hairpin-helix domain-containing protein [Niabella yanshanensis]WQD40425.1 helix-hairpin-helix domain-containing protein [Niabella yanshanensis]